MRVVQHGFPDPHAVADTELDVFAAEMAFGLIQCRELIDYAVATVPQSGSTNRLLPDYIERNPNWEFVAVYSDIASGVRTANRPGYRQLLRD